MDLSLAALLLQDGVVTGAIYALLATALVLVFSITHVPFVPLGGFVSFTALSLVAIQEQRTPNVAYVVMAMGVLCFVLVKRSKSDKKREQLKPEAALGKAFATNATFLLRCKSSRFRHFAHFEFAI